MHANKKKTRRSSVCPQWLGKSTTCRIMKIWFKVFQSMTEWPEAQIFCGWSQRILKLSTDQQARKNIFLSFKGSITKPIRNTKRQNIPNYIYVLFFTVQSVRKILTVTYFSNYPFAVFSQVRIGLTIRITKRDYT